MRVWAVDLQPQGIVWAEAELVRVTERNVVVRYAGETARLDRNKLWIWWAWWRGRVLRLLAHRAHRGLLDKRWWQRFGTAGSVPPSLQMPLADAIALLGVAADYTKAAVIAAFRKKVKPAHPGPRRHGRDVPPSSSKRAIACSPLSAPRPPRRNRPPIIRQASRPFIASAARPPLGSARKPAGSWLKCYQCARQSLAVERVLAELH